MVILQFFIKNSFSEYLLCVKIMGDYFGNNLKLKDVTVKHIEDFFDYLRDVRGNKNITVKHHAIILSPALRQAYRDDLIAKNPCEFLAKIKKKNLQEVITMPMKLKNFLKLLKMTKLNLLSSLLYIMALDEVRYLD